MTKQALIIGFTEYETQTRQLAEALSLPWELVDIHHFPDGESKLTLPTALPKHVIICRSLDYPNDKLVELILAASGARNLGAEKITLVAPYLCYMRQDKAFHPGEIVSQKIIGKLLAAYVDGILTVDSHLHRVHKLQEAVPATQAINLTATQAMAEFINKQVEQPFLIGPDGESEQWVSDIAKHNGWDYSVATKQRFGDDRVKVNLPEGEYQNRNIVLVDDVASTGKTLLEAARDLSPYQPASMSVLVTHALFVGDAQQQLHEVGISNIWSCDSIPHATNAVSLADTLARGLDELM